MKNIVMFLLVSLLLAFSLTACGGDSQNGGGSDGMISGGSAEDGFVGGNNGTVNSGTDSANGGSSVNGGTGSVNGGTGSVNGGSAVGGAVTDGAVNGSNGGSLVDDARSALDDAGNAVGRAVDGF